PVLQFSETAQTVCTQKAKTPDDTQFHSQGGIMKGKWLAAVVVSVLMLAEGLLAQKVEVGPYGGGSFFSNPQFTTSTPNPNTEVKYNFVNGGVLGIRLRENLAEHFGLEQSYTFLGNNNAQFPGALLGTRIQQFYFN